MIFLHTGSGTLVLDKLEQSRFGNETIREENYVTNLTLLAKDRIEVPYAIAYETAHFGGKMGIVSGSDNRKNVMPLIKTALETSYDLADYARTAKIFRKAKASTFKKTAARKSRLLAWNMQKQYEGHAQLVFQLKDQIWSWREKL